MKTEVQANTYAIETTANSEQVAKRKDLARLFKASPLSEDDLLFNLGLYVRSSLLVKFLVMNQMYERIKDLPGHIVEFGVWYGQNIVLMENLRAIHEPFNKQRKIIGFDTFSGYTNMSPLDKKSEVWKENSYDTNVDYVSYLKELVGVHEGCNILGHLKGNHELVVGDVTETVPQYFKAHPEALIAFAFFDIGIYKPTKVALEYVVKNMVPGGIILMDEMTWPEAPGEAIAFKEVFKDIKYKIEKCVHYPSKSIVTIL